MTFVLGLGVLAVVTVFLGGLLGVSGDALIFVFVGILAVGTVVDMVAWKIRGR